MWSDNESEVDLLGFQHYLSVISSIINNQDLLPTTIGAYGDWGSGKSTLLKMVEAQFKDNPDILVLSFNGWLFEGYEDAKTALMGTILDEIAEKRTLTEKAKHSISKLIKRVNWMQTLGSALKFGVKSGLAYTAGGMPALGLAAGTDATHLLHEVMGKAKDKVESLSEEDLDKLIKEDAGQTLRRGIREFREDFADLLKETKITTLVVIVDDLDRCMPDTIIETLEAIKLFLFVPSTAFILGADERLVKYAVRKRFPELPGERAEVGRDYLEKLIQFPIRIPSLGRSEIETYINLLFVEKTHGKKSNEFKQACKCATKADPNSLLDVRFNLGIAKEVFGTLTPELEEDLWVAQRIAPVLAAGLNGNPRQCKRFLSTLMMRLTMAKSREIDLEQRVLAKLMLLEYLKPEFFKALAELQAAQEGRPKEISDLENQLQSQPDLDSKSKTKIQINETINTWKEDNWTLQWLKTEPYLKDIDLRLYFFFSRDTLGALNIFIQRMTPKAQEILSKILHESEANQNLGLAESKGLNDAEAATIFEALSERAKQETDLGAESSSFKKILNLVEVRLELFSQYIAFIGDIPITKVPLSIIPKFVALPKDPSQITLVKTTLNKWVEQDPSSRLAKAAKKELTKFSHGNM
jgi:predicted KAP-like P-loop ATPase